MLLIDDTPIIGKEFPIFIREVYIRMMLFLVFDIVDNQILITFTIRKGGIFPSPTVKHGEVGISLQPFARRRFELLNELCNRQCRWQRHEQVNMVRHSSDTKQFGSHIIDTVHHISIKFPFMLNINGKPAPVCANDNVRGAEAYR